LKKGFEAVVGREIFLIMSNKNEEETYSVGERCMAVDKFGSTYEAKILAYDKAANV
jgi:hypothetical protein